MNKSEREAFSKVLNELFLEKDITKKYFADLTGVPVGKMYRYLNGEAMPRGENFEKIANFFGYTFEEFWNMTIGG